MMKKNDIILDFTSLLDITLIIIFFFVLFSHLDSQENKERTDEKVQELEIAIDEANRKSLVADKLAAQLEEDIEIVQDSNARATSNTVEIINYNKSDNLKIILDMNSDGWEIRVILQENLIEVIRNNSDITNELLLLFENNGFDKKQTIFCDFTYDGSEAGTRLAYNTIIDCFKEIKKEYKYLYLSETDLSIGKEE